jgi:chemotaxis protein MotA
LTRWADTPRIWPDRHGCGPHHDAQRRHGQPEELTKAIGVAFITTLYGVLLANLVFVPMASKLRNRMSMYRLEKEMIIEAVCAIRNGINPRLLQEQLSSYHVLGSGKPKKGAEQDSNVRSIKGGKSKAA